MTEVLLTSLVKKESSPEMFCIRNNTPTVHKNNTLTDEHEHQY